MILLSIKMFLQDVVTIVNHWVSRLTSKNTVEFVMNHVQLVVTVILLVQAAKMEDIYKTAPALENVQLLMTSVKLIMKPKRNVKTVHTHVRPAKYRLINVSLAKVDG